MTADETPPGPLQFDKVETDRPGAADAPALPAVTCTSCGRTIRTHYFALGAASICDLCRRSLVNASIEAQRWPVTLKAFAFALGASIAGAIVYYAVIAITNYEIGLVAILIGYMVGYSIRRATRGFGGLRYQVMAVALTYFAVGLAYMPLVLSQAPEDTATETTSTLAPSVPAPGPVAVSGIAEPVEIAQPPRPVGPGTALRALVFLILFCFALPAISVFSTFPSGVLGAVIIGVGLRQAWRMTGAPLFEVTGPYKLGGVQAR